MDFERLQVPVFAGSAYERGAALTKHFASMRGRLMKNVETAVRLREQNSEQEWLRESWLSMEAVFPELASYLKGQADGYTIPIEDLVAATRVELLKDRDKARRCEESGDGAWDDECSTFAFAVEGGGALVAKNRDNRPGLSERHTIALHRDPSWKAGWVLAVSSAGGPMAASSAMNGHGLVLVCNAARSRVVGDGFTKAAVADAFLGRCSTVDEALALICSVRLVGEGNLIVGDRHGKVAAIGMLSGEPLIEVPREPGWVARTNHFDEAHVAHLNQVKADDREGAQLSRAVEASSAGALRPSDPMVPGVGRGGGVGA